MSIEIRSATVADVGVILDLIRGLAEYERLAHECIVTASDLQDSLFGAHPGAEVLIANVDDTPAGFALFFHNYSTFLGRRGIWLEDLFVKPAYRGAGVGRQLLTHLAQVAVERQCGRLEWWVLDWNEPAVGFYRSLGAEPMSEWTTYRLTGDALLALASPGGSPA